jgi:hypothetical protein
MFDALAAPVGLAAGRRLALSAMPDAPVVAEGNRRHTQRLRRLAARPLHRIAVHPKEGR